MGRPPKVQKNEVGLITLDKPPIPQIKQTIHKHTEYDLYDILVLIRTHVQNADAYYKSGNKQQFGASMERAGKYFDVYKNLVSKGLEKGTLGV